jgi:hypothetical protein
MLKTGLVILLAMVAGKADLMNMARKAFNNCLVEVHNSGVKAKTPAAEFNKSAQDACPTERAAYKDIIAKGERAFGSSAKDADEYASGEVQSVIDSFTEAYGDNVEKGATLTPEK